MFISDFVRAGGALTGLAIGDAMGAPLEGLPPYTKTVTEMESGGIHNRIAGNFTDDTLQALAIADSLAVCRGFCPYDIVRRLIYGYRRFPGMYGPTSGAVFELVMKGADPYLAARIVHRQNGGSRTNGSVMRGPPLGIFYRGAEVEYYSIRCSELTHADPVAGACSAWLNRMVSDLCRGYSREDALAGASHTCRDDEVLGVLGRCDRFDINPSLDALDTTHAALKIFLHSRSFEDAVVRAVNLGGDTDTIGACCGALAGAFFGIYAIPVRWLSRLNGLSQVTRSAYALWNAAEW
jgi:ADP-ribosyl-[dinitrogen reductase] hydrolase